MRGRDLRHRVTIEKETQTIADSGQPVHTWAPLYRNVPARVEQVSGGEVFRGRQVAAETSTLVTTRYIKGLGDLDSEHRIKYGTRTLGIVRINNILDRDRELRIECKESDA